MVSNQQEKNTISKIIHRRKIRIRHKNKYLVFAVVLLLAISCYLIFQEIKKSNSAFVINGKSYSKKLVSSMSNFGAKYNSETQAQAAKNIYVLYKTEVASKIVGITPTSQETQAAYKNLPKTTNSTGEQYYKLIAYNNALNVACVKDAQGYDQGYEFVFNFSRYINPPVSGQPPTPGYGNMTLIAKDKAYALHAAKTDYSKYKTGNISPATLIADIEADPNLSYTNIINGVFDSTKSNNSLFTQVFYSGVYNYIIKQSKPGLSSIQVGKVSTNNKPGSKEYADGYYYFIDLKKASRTIPNASELVNNQVNKLQAVYYGI